MGESNWNDFFVATMGAAAALAGLLIVAVSINLERILEFKHLPGRAGEALTILAGAMTVAGIALMPHLPAFALGALAAATGIALCIISAWTQMSAYRLMQPYAAKQRLKRAPTHWWLHRIPIAFAGTLFVVGGVIHAAGGDGMYWIAASVLLALVIGIHVSWVLLVEIVR